MIIRKYLNCKEENSQVKIDFETAKGNYMTNITCYKDINLFTRSNN